MSLEPHPVLQGFNGLDTNAGMQGRVFLYREVLLQPA